MKQNEPENPLSEDEYEKLEELETRHMKEQHEIVLPSIVYPLQLTRYSMPCELGSYIFWNTFRLVELTLDCNLIGIPNSEKLLRLCNYRDAVDYIISKGLAG